MWLNQFVRNVDHLKPAKRNGPQVTAKEKIKEKVKSGRVKTSDTSLKHKSCMFLCFRVFVELFRPAMNSVKNV